MSNYFTFNGQKSSDFNMKIESYPNYTTAAKKISELEQPGANGVWVYDTGLFDRASVEYSVYLKADRGELPALASDVAAWLQGPIGYQQLEDTYDPDYYRMAIFAGPLDLSSWFHWYGRATLSFSCRPERWLKSGQDEQILNGTVSGTMMNIVVDNPGMPAAPIFILQNNENAYGSISAGGTTVAFSDLPAGSITFDAELMLAYETNNPDTNLTNHISGSSVLRIPSGQSIIRCSTSFTQVKMIPRWWKL